MAREGRITGRISVNGGAYELVQSGVVRQSIPVHDAMENQKLRAAIAKNKWEPLP